MAVKRKYLDDIGVTNRPDEYTGAEGAQHKWQTQREIYGFDVRETWNIDISFYCWLYERLMMYLEVTDADLTYRKFDYNGETLTHKQCIDKILAGCKYALTSNFLEDEKIIDDIAHLWALICRHTWW